MNTASTRKDLRLKSWNYSSSATYHVVFCVKDRLPLLGSVCCDGQRSFVKLTDIGNSVSEQIDALKTDSPHCTVISSVIMPNHVHLMLALNPGDQSLGKIIGRLKAKVTKEVQQVKPGLSLWQRGYYDHVIRDETDYQATLEYIANNPAMWVEDHLYCE